jgi:nitroreductase
MDEQPKTPPAQHIERILDAARLAPSYENAQPWRFVVQGDTVSLFVDHERDRSPPGAGGRMARIAVGAALECALVRAGRMGVAVRFEAPRGSALVTVTISEPKRFPEPDKALVRRATNRRLYDGRPVDDATFAWLHEATPPIDAARTLWFGRERVRTLGPRIEQGEAAFYAEPSLREAALRAIRFDVRDREEVAHGLSLGSLELSAADRLTLDGLRKVSQDPQQAAWAFKKMGARARRLVESASGVCVIAARGSEPAVDVAVGRSMMRAWLALTRRGLVAQPMSAVPVLEAILETAQAAAPGWVALADEARAEAAVAAVRAAFPNVERGSRIAMILRYGWAPDPSARVRRLPLEESISTGMPGGVGG